jgi:DNA-directed RNA polymerase specialized sigma24 family protein
LVVTLKHCASKFWRRQAHERLADEKVLVQVAGSDELAAIAAEQTANGSQLSLMRAFKRLPSNYKVILLLTAVDGQPPVLVGPILGLSPNAASALAYRARGRLRELYQLEVEEAATVVYG